MNEYLSCETCDHNIYQIPDGKTQWCYCDVCEAYDMHSDNAINNAYRVIKNACSTLMDKIGAIAAVAPQTAAYTDMIRLLVMYEANNRRKYTGKPLRRNISKRYRKW